MRVRVLFFSRLGLGQAPLRRGHPTRSLWAWGGTGISYGRGLRRGGERGGRGLRSGEELSQICFTQALTHVGGRINAIANIAGDEGARRKWYPSPFRVGTRGE